MRNMLDIGTLQCYTLLMKGITMSSLIIYHGSVSIIEHPEYGKGKPYNDYGLGFYCTESLDLAKEWAVDKDRNGYANKYALDMTDLKLLDLSEKSFTVLHWITLLLQNRVFTLKSDIAKAGKAIPAIVFAVLKPFVSSAFLFSTPTKPSCPVLFLVKYLLMERL